MAQKLGPETVCVSETDCFNPIRSYKLKGNEHVISKLLEIMVTVSTCLIITIMLSRSFVASEYVPLFMLF